MVQSSSRPAKKSFLTRSIEDLLVNAIPQGSHVLVPHIDESELLLEGKEELIGTVSRDVVSRSPVSGTAPLLRTNSDTTGTEANFDFIVLHRVLESVYEIRAVLASLNDVLPAHGRLVSISYSRIFQPLRAIGAKFRRQRSPYAENWIPGFEISNFLEQTGFEVITASHHVLIPFRIPLLSRFVNRWIAPLPLIRSLTLVSITTARVKRPTPRICDPSVSVVIAARNEAGNISELLDRIPLIASRQEVILVEGGSKDQTWETIEREVSRRNTLNPQVTYLASQQSGTGKADAVRRGFDLASGDILIILDADISVPPEELRFFIDQLVMGTCDFANGSRLVYEMDAKAMRFLNLVGNRLFGTLFTYLLGQPIRDTLCGTKALWSADYQRIVSGRSYFGNFDPFGDFDLLFGASRLHLRIRDVPVHYKERTYGSTNISRFRHGLLLIRMSWVAARKLRFR